MQDSNIDCMLQQIPEEEKNLGPHDRLIHVYHFMKDTAQNQVVSTSGWPWDTAPIFESLLCYEAIYHLVILHYIFIYLFFLLFFWI